jgi:glycogen debranching enzyme
VWPHDNAIAAAGMMRYGFVEEAHRVMKAQLDVAAAFGGRLPELFAGFERGHPATPAAYPTSCSPQAWASAAPLLWLRTLLRIDPWAPQREVRIAPELPPWIRRLCVDNIRIADRKVSVRVEGDDVEISGTGDLHVIRTPRITRDYYATTWRPSTDPPSTDW